MLKRLFVTNRTFPQLSLKISGGGRTDVDEPMAMVEPLVDPEHLRLPIETLASSKSYSSGP